MKSKSLAEMVWRLCVLILLINVNVAHPIPEPKLFVILVVGWAAAMCAFWLTPEK